MNKFDMYIGIDAGKSGAIAHITANSFPIAVSMPESVDQMNEYLLYLKTLAYYPVACIEKVNTWRTDADQGKTFGIEKLVRNYNEIATVLRLVKIPFIPVYPIQWQTFLGIKFPVNEERPDRKRRLKSIAQIKFPSIAVTLTNADALLIMQFIAYKCQRDPEWVIKRLPESIVKSLDL